MPDTPRRRFNWWFLILGLIMLLLALLTLSKSHTLVETSTELDATPEQVWAVLSDLPHYNEWNSLIPAASGSLNPGDKVQLSVQIPTQPKKDITATVLKAEEQHELRWIGRVGMPRIFDAEHYMVIDTENASPGKIKFVNGESFSGILVPFMAKMLDTKGRQGYEAMNADLQKRIAALYPALLPGSPVSYLCAPAGATVFGLQPSETGGAPPDTETESPAGEPDKGAALGQPAMPEAYTSSIAYFTLPEGSAVTLETLGDQLIQHGFDLVHSDNSSGAQRTDFYRTADGKLEVLLGHFSTPKQVADALAGVGHPVFPPGFPEAFKTADAYTGYRIELREH